MIYDPYPFKRCKQCGNDFPATKRYFYKSHPHTLSGKCKACYNAYGREYNLAHPEKAREHRRRWNAANRERKNELQRGYNKRHPEYNREWQKNNPDKVRRAKRKSYIKYHSRNTAYAHDWRARNPDKVRVQKAQDRARRKRLPRTLTYDKWQLCLNYWHGCCAYCGSPAGLLNELQISREHFIPLNAPNCPGDIPENVIPACKSCNSSKQDRDPVEWLTERLGKRKARQKLAEIEAYFAWVKAQK